MSDEQQNIPTDGAQQGNNGTGIANPAAGDGPVPGAEALEGRIAQLEKENEDLRDKWLRAAADYKNFKRRADQERADLIRGASAGLLLKLLPVMDDLERAMSSVSPDIEATPWYGGF